MNSKSGLKIAITGKGGVGKTTLAAALAKVAVDSGFSVIAVDADSDANLSSALGLPPEVAAKIVPISQLKEVISERTGSSGESFGLFTLNPRVDDIPEKYYYQVGEIKLMVMGRVEAAGRGCICPESAFLKRLTQHLVLERKELVILDMEAGVEHLGRATAKAVDVFLVVLEPGGRSIQTANTIYLLARELGVGKVFGILNKVVSSEQSLKVRSLLEETDQNKKRRPTANGGRRSLGIKILGEIKDYPDIREGDLLTQSPWQASPKFMEDVQKIWERMWERMGSTKLSYFEA